jgi:hypothetical protein
MRLTGLGLAIIFIAIVLIGTLVIPLLDKTESNDINTPANQDNFTQEISTGTVTTLSGLIPMIVVAVLILAALYMLKEVLHL